MGNKICEGSCDPHKGEVVRVHVTDTGKDWGEFDYCQEAIAEDRRRGLSVELLSNSEYYSTMQPTNPEPDPARD
jgi:hypothetical protein